MSSATRELGGRAARGRRAAAVDAARGVVARSPALSSFVAFCGLAALSRPASLRMPLPEDAGFYLYIGQLIAGGDTPYVDAADHKPPGYMLLAALIQAVAGTSAVAVRLTLLLAAGAASLALALYVARRAGWGAGFLAGATLAVLSSMSAVHGAEPTTEQYGIVAMTAALLFASGGGARSAAASGIAVGLAVMTNVGFVAIVPIVLLELWQTRAAGRAAARLLAASAGAAAVAGAILLWLASAGALDDWLEFANVYIDAARSGEVPAVLTPETVRPRPVTLRHLLEVPAGGLWVAALAGALVAIRNARIRPLALIAVAWIIVMWARVKAAGWEYEHYYYPAVPGIALGLTAGIAALWSGPPPQRASLAALVLALPVWVYVVGPQWRALDIPVHDRWGHNSPYAVAYPVASFISERTRADDQVFMAGAAGQVYWLTERTSPTRYFTEYLVTEVDGARAERLRDLRARPPAAIGVLPTDRVDGDIARFIAERRYRLAFEQNGARVWLARR